MTDNTTNGSVNPASAHPLPTPNTAEVNAKAKSPVNAPSGSNSVSEQQPEPQLNIYFADDGLDYMRRQIEDDDTTFDIMFSPDCLILCGEDDDDLVRSKELCAKCSDYFLIADKQIRDGFKTFATVGALLQQMKSHGLYRKSFDSFSEYFANVVETRNSGNKD